MSTRLGKGLQEPYVFFHCKRCKRPVYRLPTEGTKRAFVPEPADPCPYCEWKVVKNNVVVWDRRIENGAKLYERHQKKLFTTIKDSDDINKAALKTELSSEEWTKWDKIEDEKIELSKSVSQRYESLDHLREKREGWILDWERRWRGKFPFPAKKPRDKGKATKVSKPAIVKKKPSKQETIKEKQEINKKEPLEREPPQSEAAEPEKSEAGPSQERPQTRGSETSVPYAESWWETESFSSEEDHEAEFLKAAEDWLARN